MTEKTVFPDPYRGTESYGASQRHVTGSSASRGWVDEGEQSSAYNLLVMFGNMGLPAPVGKQLSHTINIMGARMRQCSPWMGDLFHISVEAISQVARWLSLNANLKVSEYKYSSRRRMLSDQEFELKLKESEQSNTPWKRALVSGEAWKRLIRDFINDWIICPDRYNAQGKIPHWSGRLYAAYCVGDETIGVRSPYHIYNQAPGEGQTFIHTTRHQGGLTLQMMFANTVAEFFKMLRVSEFLHAVPGGSKVESCALKWKQTLLNAVQVKVNLDCNPALNISKERTITKTAESATKAYPRYNITNTKTSYAATSTLEQSAAVHWMKRFFGATSVIQISNTQITTCERDYPTDNRGRNAPNEKLRDLRNKVFETGPPSGRFGSPEEAVALAVNALSKRREESNRTCINAKSKRLDRIERSHSLENFYTLPYTARSRKCALASQTSGKTQDARSYVQIGFKATAFIKNIQVVEEIQTELKCFVRINVEKILPRRFKEFVEVTNDVGDHHDGSNVLSSINIKYSLGFSEGHTAQDVNDALAKCGNLYGNTLPFPKIPTVDAVSEAPYLPPVERDICLTAKLTPDQLNRLRLALSNGHALKVAKAHKINAQDVAQMQQAGFSEAENTYNTLWALGKFIGRQQEPSKALRYLSEVCGGSWFDVHKDSNIGTIDRVAKEAADLHNTLHVSTYAPQEPWPQLVQHLAMVQKMLDRVAFLKKRPKDLFTSTTWDQKHRHVLKQTEDKLSELSIYCKKRLAPFNASVSPVDVALGQHLLATGIVTESDWLTAHHIDHPNHLRRELDKLVKANLSHLTEDQREKMVDRIRNMQDDLCALGKPPQNLSQNVKIAPSA